MSTPAHTSLDPHVLDNPAWAALSGAHTAFAEYPAGGGARAARYSRDVSPFAALADPEDPRSWADLRALVGDGEVASLAGC